MTADLGFAARWYAEHGYQVFPLAPRSKVPLLSKESGGHGCYDGTTDLNQIDRWWAENPKANIGLQLSGLIVVDADNPERGGPGDEQAALKNRLGHSWGDTWEQITGGGGRHVIFRAHADRDRVGEIERGIDIKAGPGAYIVVAPSIHDKTGRGYEPDGMKDYSLTDLADEPGWLYERTLKREPARQNQADKTNTAEETYADGGRNKSLTSEAGKMRRIGMSTEVIAAALLAVNRERCKPPLTDDEVRGIAQSVGRYAPGIDPSQSVVRVEVPLAAVSLDTLNSHALFSSRGLRFIRVSRRGSRYYADVETPRGARGIRWPTLTDLLTFARAQAAIAACGIVIASPRKGEVRPTWESVAQIIIAIAEQDCVDTGDEVSGETEEMLERTFTAAARPTATLPWEMVHIMGQIRDWKRYDPDPNAIRTPPCIFLAEGATWVHIPSWRAWLSTPAGYNRLFPLRDLRDGLAVCGFVPVARVTRRHGQERQDLDLWRCDGVPEFLKEAKE